MKRSVLVLSAAVVWLSTLPSAFSCTTFVLNGDGRVYFGRNLDWEWEDGMVVVNPRSIRKTAFVNAEDAVKWTSKYGSVTFNQFGSELPFGGMNETGLVVENMWLDGTMYPPEDERPEINMLQWIQYQLDNCRSVEEVIQSDKTVRLENTPVRARIHYFVCDANGDCATIEFLNGAMLVHRGRSLPYHALANDPYQWSADYLRDHPTKGAATKPLTETDSASRFCRAAVRAAGFKPAAKPKQDIAYAFETLDQVRQGDSTVWQIVYDISRRQIDFRTLSNRRIRRIEFKTLNFDCRLPRQAADIRANTTGSGGLSFHELTPEESRGRLEGLLTQESFRQTVGDLTPMVEPMLQTIQGYTCAD